MRTGDKVIYMSDVFPERTGQIVIADSFDMIGGMVSIVFADKTVIWCFPDEIKSI